MRVAFVYPPFKHKLFNENLTTVDDEFGRFPSLGIAYAAAVMERWGAECKVWDAYADSMTREEVLKEVLEFKPDLLGFTIHAITTFWDQMSWIKWFKEKTGLPLLVGGHETGNYVDDIMVHPEIDYACLGDAPQTLPLFMDAFAGGAEDFSKCVGIKYRDKKTGEVRATPMPQTRVRFDDYPFPARHLLPNDKYYSHVSQLRNFTVFMTSIGCPYTCNFCALANSPFSPRTPESVLREMDECVHKHGIREFDFFDPLMLADRNRSIEICKGIVSAGWKIMWSCRSRVDIMDEELLRWMADSGCQRIYYGIESGDQTILNKISKGITLAQIRRTIEMTHDAGIRPLGFFQFGSEGESEQTVQNTIKFAKSLPLYYAQFMQTIAKPDSDLEEQVKDVLGYDYYREYVRGNVPEMRLPTPWNTMPPEEIEEWIKKAYLSFYGRPRYAWRMIREAQSLGEIAKYIRVGTIMALRKTRFFKDNFVVPEGMDFHT